MRTFRTLELYCNINDLAHRRQNVPIIYRVFNNLLIYRPSFLFPKPLIFMAPLMFCAKRTLQNFHHHRISCRFTRLVPLCPAHNAPVTMPCGKPHGTPFRPANYFLQTQLFPSYLLTYETLYGTFNHTKRSLTLLDD